MTYLTPESALHRLAHGELCIVVLQDGTQREASWHKENRWFRFCDGKGAGIAKPDEIEEWMPASVKF